MAIFFVNMCFEVWAENEDSAEEAVNGLLNWANQPDNARVEAMYPTSIDEYLM